MDRSDNKMLPAGWFHLAGAQMGDWTFYMHSPFRHRQFRWSFITLIVLGVVAIAFIQRGWSRISVLVILWLALALFNGVFLLLIVLRSHESLHLLLTSGQIEPPKEGSPLGIVLNVVADVSNWALALAFSSIGLCLLALIGMLGSR
jgi:hypothetical protein